MSEHVDKFLGAFAAALEPRPKLTVSEWAARHRVLPSKGASEPGPWRNERTPYLVEPMDCLSPHHPAEVVVLMFGSQLGKSEAGNNFVGYIVDYAPGPVLLVQPTVEAAEQYSRQRIAPMCALPPIAGKVRDPRDRDAGNTILEKEFPGGTLILRGANSATGLSSMPIKYAFFDEVDRYHTDADENGDPVALGMQRTRTFPDRKILITSTPTIKGTSRVEAEFDTTDQRRYFVPCPRCGGEQVLRWTPTEEHPGGMVWEGHDPRGTCAYQCEHCRGRILPHERDAMVAAGRWKATAPGDGRRVGFHLSSLASPWAKWPDLVEEFLAAKRESSATKLKAFVNLQLGEAWDSEEASSVEGKALLQRLERGWGPGTSIEVPAAACVITAGVDIQPVRGCIVLEVVAWGEGYESWSLDYLRIDGDPTLPPPGGIWRELDAALSRRYRHPVLGDLPIRAACVDTGAATNNAYAFVRPRQKRRVWAVKGRDDQGQPIWPDKVKSRNRGGVDLRSINTGQAKEDIFHRLRVRTPGPGYCHFPAGRDASYFEELTAETQRITYRNGRGKRQWVVREGARNEALDVRVYAYAALLGLVRQRVVALKAPTSKAAMEPTAAPPLDTTPEQRDAAAAPRAPRRTTPAPPAKRRRASHWSEVLDW